MSANKPLALSFHISGFQDGKIVSSFFSLPVSEAELNEYPATAAHTIAKAIKEQAEISLHRVLVPKHLQADHAE